MFGQALMYLIKLSFSIFGQNFDLNLDKVSVVYHIVPCALGFTFLTSCEVSISLGIAVLKMILHSHSNPDKSVILGVRVCVCVCRFV